jgi:4-aminobutyrate aminotransferase-like enzyme/Ser/Thr protein kinase RdoA (MazF antagonist)
MTRVSSPPTFASVEAERIAKEIYGIQSKAMPLPSERDQNFRLRTSDGKSFVLKIANANEQRDMLDAENAAMTHLAQTGLCPCVVPSEPPHIFKIENHFVRLVTWLDGKPMGAVKRHTDALLSLVGSAIGTIDRALLNFDHPAIHRDFHWDLANAPRVVQENISRVEHDETRRAIEKLFATFQTTVAPTLNTFRKSAIHNDANDYNIIVGGDGDCYTRDQSVVGVVDFGDMVFSHTINDLAIAAAYACLDKDDPLTSAAQIVRGYHAANPLEENEIAALFSLMCIRLCVSACLASKQQAERPDDAYLAISQQPIQNTLPVLANIHSRFAHYTFRHACGLEPVPHTTRVRNWLLSNQKSFASIVDVDLKHDKIAVFDLSVGSSLLGSDAKQNDAAPLTQRLFAKMRDENAVIGVNGYDEARVFYTAPAFMGKHHLDETRTIHVAIDLTLPASSPIYAPLEGTVFGFEDATDRLDYGPVIVLRHEADGIPFYTLYGHLSRESLEGLSIGMKIAKGERFASIGAPPINGDWWPHVHFQIITDLLDIPCNFNGSALASQREIWKSISPDPNLILGIPESVLQNDRRSNESLLKTRRQRIGENLSVSYRKPLQIVRGWMQYLYDENGRRYLDAYNNVPHVGHSHPRVVKAVQDQWAVLNTNTRYLQKQLTEYAERLTALLPKELCVCFFTASGSEANELAIRLARARTRQRDLIVMDAAYHGHTTTLIDISPYKHNGPGGEGAPDWVHVSPIPDVYRGEFKASDPLVGLKYAQRVGEVIARLRESGRRLCGYIAETCPSVGGQIMLPNGYLAETYRLVREAGGVCIADEVQTGFGRIGTHFWAFEQHGVVPDIVVLGKPIGNGYPMGAVICAREIAESFDNGMEFFSTFGGSTATCAAGLATLQVTLEENLQPHALTIGNLLLSAFNDLKIKHELIGDVRGSGLFLGIELVRNRDTLEPAAEEASYVVNRMRELGVLLGTDGPFHNVIKIRGPMLMNEKDATSLIDIFKKVLIELE